LTNIVGAAHVLSAMLRLNATPEATAKAKERLWRWCGQASLVEQWRVLKACLNAGYA
jgi:hypothetical protein